MAEDMVFFILEFLEVIGIDKQGLLLSFSNLCFLVAAAKRAS
jgi:hypothetical protein